MVAKYIMPVLALGMVACRVDGDEPGAPRASEEVLAFSSDPIPGCVSCSITVEHRASIGLDAGEDGPTRDSRVARDSHGRWYLTRTYRSGSVARFNPDGTLDRVFGREGSGPAEFLRAMQVEVGPGDTLYIRDGQRIAIWSPALEPIRTFITGGWDRDDFAVFPDGRLVLEYQDRTRDPPERLHVISSEGRHLETFGDSGQPYDEMNGEREIAIAPDGTLWAAWQSEYRLERFDPGGLRPFTVRHEWPGLSDGQGSRDIRATRRILDIKVDSAGRVWILLSIENPDYEPPVGHDPSMLLDMHELAKKVDSVIDVLDPSTGAVVARARTTDPLGGFVGSSVYRFVEVESGELIVEIIDLNVAFN